MRSLDDYAQDAQKRPAATAMKLGCLVLVIIMALRVVGAGLTAFGFFTGAANNAVAVAKKEFYPDAMLRKYEWFKDAAAALDKKQADIRVYDTRLKSLGETYAGVPRTGWARDDREQWSIWASEVAGVKASYNGLAAEYNANMVKFNYKFTNVGDLPPGASTPLPREYRPYIED
jgi:hypothetical protein